MEPVKFANTDNKCDLKERTLGIDQGGGSEITSSVTETSLYDLKQINNLDGPTQKLCSEESVQLDKKRSKHLPHKHDAQPTISSVLSFAEWLKSNSQNENEVEKQESNELKEEQANNTAKKRQNQLTDVQQHSCLQNIVENKLTNETENSGTNIEEVHDSQMPYPKKSENSNTEANIGLSEASVSRVRRRRKKKRLTKLKASNQSTEPKQKHISCRSSSLSPSKHDKTKCKRTEIDILIESMSKEMKDGGIEHLLNDNKHVKRQRASSKRTAFPPNQTMPLSEVSPTDKRIEDIESSEVAPKKKIFGEFSQKSPKRSLQLQEKSKFLKESKGEVVGKDEVISIETEKALIDEIEIRNMNTTILETLKFGTSYAKTSPFKTPMVPDKISNSILATISKTQLSGDMLRKSETNKVCNLKIRSTHSSRIKCRKFRVRINKSVVRKYWENVKRDDMLSQPSLKEVNVNPIRNYRKGKLYNICCTVNINNYLLPYSSENVRNINSKS